MGSGTQPGSCFADRIGQINETLSLDRQQFLVDAGGLPWPDVAEVIELLGTEVLPQVTTSPTATSPTT